MNIKVDDPTTGRESTCGTCGAGIEWSEGNDKLTPAWEDRQLSQFGSDGHEHKPAERTPIGNDECGCPVYAAPEVRGDDADTLVEHIADCPALDDGPGRDQHGPHERPGAVSVDPALMTGGRYIVGSDGVPYGPFPSPDAGAVAATVEPEPVEVRLRRILRYRDAGRYSHDDTAKLLLALFAEDRSRTDDIAALASQRASHEGATVSDAEGGCE